MSRDENQDLEDLSLKGKCLSLGDMRQKVKECKVLDELLNWNLETGEFEPSVCHHCLFPNIGHKSDFCWGTNKGRNPGTPAKSGWNESTILQMKSIIMNDAIIRAEVDSKDTCPHKTVCTCGRQFKTRLELQEHEMLKHKRSNQSQMVTTSSVNQTKDSYHSQPPVIVQVSDPPKVPKWEKEDFDTFEGRIGEFIKCSKDDKSTQYQKLVDSLKENDRKKGVSEFIVNKILENADHERTVEAVLNSLRVWQK